MLLRNEESFPIVCAKWNGDRWNGSIAECLMDMLQEAEDLFGSRDKEFTLLGIGFIDAEQPQISFYDKFAIIQLTDKAFHDLYEACFQASHECVHLLSPLVKGETSVLEEGVATYFQKLYMKKHFDHEPKGFPEYEAAYKLVLQLLSFDQDAIKKLKETERVLSKITKEIIFKHCQELCPKLVEELVQPFSVFKEKIYR